jgi:hypothetical protein
MYICIYVYCPFLLRRCQDLHLSTVKHPKEAVVVPGWSDEGHDKTSQIRRIQNGYVTNKIIKSWDYISMVVKVSLHITKKCGVVEVQIHPFLISTLDKDEW